MQNLSEFVDALRELRILETEKLRSLATAHQNGSIDTRSLAKKLIDSGELTPYQANLLLKGRGKELLLGKYVLLERLGEGGMGAVFKARDSRLDQICALKVIRKDRLGNPETVRRFEREIRAAAKLEHPNIVRALDADEVDGTHLLSLEFVEGRDLAKIVKQNGPLSIQTACEYIRQAALGLQHAHECGMVHRDIKLANLLVASDESRGTSEEETETVKILDMGLARFARTDGDSGDDSGTMTQEGMIMGTLDYIAPEQATDTHSADIRADIYSLGCTFYFLLTGSVPFPGGDMLSKLIRQKSEEPRPVRELRPIVPEVLATIIRQMMAKEPEQRFQHPSELAEVLAELAPRFGSLDATASLDQTVRVAKGGIVEAQTIQQLWKQAVTPAHSGATTNRQPAESPDLGWRGLVATFRRFPPAIRWGTVITSVLLLGLLTWFVGAHVFYVETPHGTLVIKSDDPGIKILIKGETVRIVDLAKQQEIKLEVGKYGISLANRKDGLRLSTKEITITRGKKKILEVTFKPKSTTGTLVIESDDPKAEIVIKSKDGTLRRTIKAGEIELKPGKYKIELPQNNKDLWLATKEITIAPGKNEPIRVFRFSPLDKLDPANIPAEERYDWQPKDLVAVLGSHRFRHWDRVWSVAYSPDGKLIASGGSRDGVVRLWEVATGREMAALKGHTEGLWCVAFGPNGKTLFSASADNTIRLWDVDTGKHLRTLNGHTGDVRTLTFTPDGRTLVSGSFDRTVRSWDISTGKELMKLGGHTDRVESVAISQNGKKLAAACHDGTVRLWDLIQRKETKTWKAHNGLVRGVHFAPDDDTLVTGGKDRLVKIWDVGTGIVRKTLKGHTDAIDYLALSSDGKTIASAGYDDSIRLWDLEQGKLKRIIRSGWYSWIHSVDFSPDGKHLASGRYDRGISIWDVSTGKRVRKQQAGYIRFAPDESITFAPNNKKFVSVSRDGTLKLYDLRNPNQPPVIVPHRWQRSAAAFSPDSRMVASSGNDGVVTLWDVATSKVALRLSGYKGWIFGVAFSPDGKKLASASGDKTVRLWDIAMGKEKSALQHPAFVASVAFSPDSKLVVSACSDHTVRLWDTTSGEQKAVFRGHTTAVGCVDYSPDGKRVVSGSGDRTVRLWDVTTGKLLDVLEAHESSVTGVAYAPDGKKVVSSGADGQVILWNIESGTPRKWQLPGRVEDVVYSTDDRHIAIANGNGTIYILRVAHIPQAARKLPPIDLLKMIDLKKDTIAGHWKLQGGTLVSPPSMPAGKGTFACLQVPYQPPDEYDLSFTATRKTGSDALNIGFVNYGNLAHLVFDGWSGLTALEAIDGRGGHGNETTTETRIFKTGIPVKIVCSVRRNQVKVIVDGKTFINWQGASSRLKVGKEGLFKNVNHECLFVGSHLSSFEIRNLTLQPVTGVGRNLRMD